MDTNKVLRETITNMMKNGTYEIKPCPFCGGQPEIEDRKTFEKLDRDGNGACITIECNNCSLCLYDHTHDEHDYYVRAFLLVEKWNRRAK